LARDAVEPQYGFDGERFPEFEMNIAAWLRGLDLDRYERAFRDNDIDSEFLGDSVGPQEVR
jgi:hypothetical protein